MKIAALTHVRNDDAFLDVWVKYYGGILGLQNLFIILDGDDWEPLADLTGTNVIVEGGQRGGRVFTDQKMSEARLRVIDDVFAKDFDFIVVGDCDELLLLDVQKNSTFQAEAAKLADDGYTYLLGLDLVQHPEKEKDLDPAFPLLTQRNYGLVSQSYSKVGIIGKAFVETNKKLFRGGHKIRGGRVSFKTDLYLLHLALCNEPWSDIRAKSRSKNVRQASFLRWIETRDGVKQRLLDSAPVSLASVIETAKHQIGMGDDGPVQWPRTLEHGNVGDGTMYGVTIDGMFGDVI